MTRTPPDPEVAELLHRLAGHARTEPDPLAGDRPPPRARGTWSVTLAGALILVALIGASLVVRQGRHDPVASAAGPSPLPGGVTERLADAGLAERMFASSVWTGREVLVWGGFTMEPSGRRLFADGVALDPVANRWRALPPAPIAARSSAAAVWTGTEMLVSGGDGDQPLADGAAFNPETNRWRTIAGQPSGGASRPATVWTGTEMIVLNNSNPSAMWAYEPLGDRWRQLEAPPGSLVGPYAQVAWTGSEILAVLSPSGSVGLGGPVGSAVLSRVDAGSVTSPVPAPPSASGAPAGALVPDATQGAGPAASVPPVLPPPPLPDISALGGQGPNSGMFLASYSPWSGQWSRLPAVPLKDNGLPLLVWTGREVLVLQAHIAGAAFDVGKRTWRPLAELPVGIVNFSYPVWTGRLALLWSGGDQGLAYDPATDRWRTFDAGGLEQRTESVVVWAGRYLVGWGGFGNRPDGSGRLYNDGVRYRPPAA